MEDTYEVRLTGEFLAWFSGTGMAEGQTYGEPDLIAAHEAYTGSVSIPRTRGESRLLTGTKPALLAIREAALGFLQLCGPGFDSSPGERRGCRETIKRINQALGEEV